MLFTGVFGTSFEVLHWLVVPASKVVCISNGICSTPSLLAVDVVLTSLVLALLDDGCFLVCSSTILSQQCRCRQPSCLHCIKHKLLVVPVASLDFTGAARSGNTGSFALNSGCMVTWLMPCSWKKSITGSLMAEYTLIWEERDYSLYLKKSCC